MVYIPIFKRRDNRRSNDEGQFGPNYEFRILGTAGASFFSIIKAYGIQFAGLSSPLIKLSD